MAARLAIGMVLGVFVFLMGCEESRSPSVHSPAEGIPAYSAASPDPEPRYHSERILLRFAPGVSQRARDEALAAAGVRKEKAYRHIPGLHVARLQTGTLSTAIAALAQNPHVLYAERDAIIRIGTVEAVEPDDPDYGELWGLPHIGAPEGWALTTGSPDVVLAVLDTGVDYTHPDLKDNMWRNPGEVRDGHDSDGNGYVDDIHGWNAITGTGDPMDDHGHGTHVAGTIAARGNNGIGIAGVAWEGQIIACKFLTEEGSGLLTDALECLDYVLDIQSQYNLDIVLTNNSWGGRGCSQALEDAIKIHNAAGILFVAAAGNEGFDNDDDGNKCTDKDKAQYPASYDVDNIISVAALDKENKLASFSNFGETTVHLAAPGVNIYSTWPGNDYIATSGTSMAAPHVSGVLALLKAQDPRRNGAALKEFLLDGVQPVDALAGKVMTGGGLLAWGANDKGALNCGRYAREWSSATGTTLVLGDDFRLEAISIAGCYGDAATSLPVEIIPDGEALDLLPQGDGLYALSWSPATSGPRTFRLDTGEEIAVTWESRLTPYEAPMRVSFAPRELLVEPAGSGEYVVVPPFPLYFGNHPEGFEELWISSRGVLSFSGSLSGLTVQELPAQEIETLVIPLQLAAKEDAVVSWGTLGAAPEREWIVQWDIPYEGVCGNRHAVAQIVFLEESSSFLLNVDTDAGEECPHTFDALLSGTQTSVADARLTPAFPDVDAFTYLWVVGDIAAQPVAVAHSVTEPVEPGTAVTLVGSDSYVAEGSIIAYEWMQVSGLPVTWQTDVHEPDPVFVAPPSGNTVFLLTVYGESGVTDATQVSVRINQNLPPVADAGADRTGLASGDVAELDGRASYDPDGAIVSYAWQQISGLDVEWLGPKNVDHTTVRLPATGRVVFRLRVVDDSAASDEVHVAYALSDNLSPIVKIDGPDEAFPGSLVYLDARGSHDPDGRIVSYRWRQIAGPPPVRWEGAQADRLSFLAPEGDGKDMVLALAVVDDSGAKTTGQHTVRLMMEVDEESTDTPSVDVGSVSEEPEEKSTRGCHSAGASAPLLLIVGWLLMVGTRSRAAVNP